MARVARPFTIDAQFPESPLVPSRIFPNHDILNTVCYAPYDPRDTRLKLTNSQIPRREHINGLVPDAVFVIESSGLRRDNEPHIPTHTATSLPVLADAAMARHATVRYPERLY